jgi:hypothetical protein
MGLSRKKPNPIHEVVQNVCCNKGEREEIFWKSVIHHIVEVEVVNLFKCFE